MWLAVGLPAVGDQLVNHLVEDGAVQSGQVALLVVDRVGEQVLLVQEGRDDILALALPEVARGGHDRLDGADEVGRRRRGHVREGNGPHGEPLGVLVGLGGVGRQGEQADLVLGDALEARRRAQAAGELADVVVAGLGRGEGLAADGAEVRQAVVGPEVALDVADAAQVGARETLRVPVRGEEVEGTSQGLL